MACWWILEEEGNEEDQAIKKMKSLDDEVCRPAVANARMPHTTTTSLWGDGTPGPLTVVFEDGAVPQKRLDQINEKYRGRLFAFCSPTDTHMMNADTTIKMYHSTFTHAFRARRKALNLSGKKGAVLFDAFTGNEAISGGQAVLRREWSESTNVHISTKIPGRGSVKSQPCDKVHGHWRRLQDAAEAVTLGMAVDPLKRASLQSIIMGDIRAAPRQELEAEQASEAVWWVPCVCEGVGCDGWASGS